MCQQRLSSQFLCLRKASPPTASNRNSQEKTNKTQGNVELSKQRKFKVTLQQKNQQTLFQVVEVNMNYHESQGHLQHAMEMAHDLCVFYCQIPIPNLVFSCRMYQTRASKVAPGKKTTPSLTTEFNPGTHMVGGKKLTPWAGEIAHVQLRSYMHCSKRPKLGFQQLCPVSHKCL